MCCQLRVLPGFQGTDAELWVELICCPGCPEDCRMEAVQGPVHPQQGSDKPARKPHIAQLPFSDFLKTNFSFHYNVRKMYTFILENLKKNRPII